MSQAPVGKPPTKFRGGAPICEDTGAGIMVPRKPVGRVLDVLWILAARCPWRYRAGACRMDGCGTCRHRNRRRARKLSGRPGVAERQVALPRIRRPGDQGLGWEERGRLLAQR